MPGASAQYSEVPSAVEKKKNSMKVQLSHKTKETPRKQKNHDNKPTTTTTICLHSVRVC